MAFIISRFIVQKGQKSFVQDVGGPLPTFELAEKKLVQTQMAFSQFKFEIREVEETLEQRDSWLRKGFLPKEDESKPKPAKQESLTNRLGENQNRFLPLATEIPSPSSLPKTKELPSADQDLIERAVQERKEAGIHREE